MELFARIVQITGRFLEFVGVTVIVAGSIHAIVRPMHDLDKSCGDAFTRFRRQLGRGILVGLEFLVAGDIIRTVAVEPSFRSLGILGGIVAIRTFLSFTLELETTGRWPWQRGGTDTDTE